MKKVLHIVSVAMITFGALGCVGPQTTWSGIGICLALMACGLLMKGLVNYRG